VFITFVSFYFCVLWLPKEQALRLTQLLMLIVAQQCVYAIIYYALGFRRFHSPGFGPRAVGTFDNPSYLYPLCLVGAPISLVLAEVEVAFSWKWLWRGIGTIMLVALVLTYTRAGWIACGVSLGYLALSIHSPLSKQKITQWGLIGLALALLAGTVFVRTKGKVIGNPDDRSFWGRRRSIGRKTTKIRKATIVAARQRKKGHNGADAVANFVLSERLSAPFKRCVRRRPYELTASLLTGLLQATTMRLFQSLSSP